MAAIARNEQKKWGKIYYRVHAGIGGSGGGVAKRIPGLIPTRRSLRHAQSVLGVKDLFATK